MVLIGWARRWPYVSPAERMRPGLALVLAAPDGRAIPRVPGRDQERAAPAVDDDVVDRPALAQQAAHLAVANIFISSRG